MAELQHFSHDCALTSPEVMAFGICNICYKDEPVEFTCKSCNFDLCKACSKLPQKVSHGFHPDHPLEFCLGQYDRKPGHIICSGCGNMSSGSFYECKECEIYLDLCCALQKNTVTPWDVRELHHYSHAHMVKRCRPGPDARGSCLLCELPLSPSAICYGCVYCYSFFHEHCLHLPREIQHPMHPEHPLKRLDYTQTCGDLRACDACRRRIDSVPFGCLECGIDIHLRCADTLLRGLKCRSRYSFCRKKMFYIGTKDGPIIEDKRSCEICMISYWLSSGPYYHCLDCNEIYHLECLKIPEYVVKKSFHIHPLLLKRFDAKGDSLEYCGVCETMVLVGNHSYSCKKCDFVGHIECILRKEAPSPLYLKDLYSSGKGISNSSNREDVHETNIVENELMQVNDIGHTHVMKPVHMRDLDRDAVCKLCDEKICGRPYKCEACNFQTHYYCAELGLPSRRHGLHRDHPLTLLPKPPSRHMMKCNICKEDIEGFNLFCRVCDFIIHISCALKGKHHLGSLGQKVIGTQRGNCKSQMHNSLAQVMVSRSYPTSCRICRKSLCGEALSCITCREMYHPQCVEVYS